MKISEASNALESLGNESRLSIFRVLVRAGPAGLPVGKLQQRRVAGVDELRFYRPFDDAKSKKIFGKHDAVAAGR